MKFRVRRSYYFHKIMKKQVILLPLDDYLEPKEEILFKVPVRYGKDRYTAYLTDRSIILYARRGTIIKNDDVVRIKLQEVDEVQFKEEGILRKMGTLVISFRRRKVRIEGHPKAMRQFYMHIPK